MFTHIKVPYELGTCLRGPEIRIHKKVSYELGIPEVPLRYVHVKVSYEVGAYLRSAHGLYLLRYTHIQKEERYAYMYICTFTYKRTHTQKCECTNTHICVCHTKRKIYTHTRAHVHMNTRTHTRKCVSGHVCGFRSVQHTRYVSYLFQYTLFQ